MFTVAMLLETERLTLRTSVMKSYCRHIN